MLPENFRSQEVPREREWFDLYLNLLTRPLLVGCCWMEILHGISTKGALGHHTVLLTRTSHSQMPIKIHKFDSCINLSWSVSKKKNCSISKIIA